jgi:hypothetical protein
MPEVQYFLKEKALPQKKVLLLHITSSHHSGLIIQFLLSSVVVIMQQPMDQDANDYVNVARLFG